MVTINGIQYQRMPCGALVRADSVTEQACCLACIVILSEFPAVNESLTSR